MIINEHFTPAELEEARLLSLQSSHALKALVLDPNHKPTAIELQAHVFALEREAEEKLYEAKVADWNSERSRESAKRLYDIAKEELRAEKARHALTMDGFAREKVKHKLEVDRHAAARAQFRKDAEPWRKIIRDEKEVERQARKAQEDEVDRWVAEQQDKKEAAPVSDAKSEGYKDTLSSI